MGPPERKLEEGEAGARQKDTNEGKQLKEEKWWQVPVQRQPQHTPLDVEVEKVHHEGQVDDLGDDDKVAGVLGVDVPRAVVELVVGGQPKHLSQGHTRA